MALQLRLILVRHAETQLNRDGRVQGSNADPLSPFGRQQAKALACALKYDLPFAFYASSVPRALETARIISETLGVPCTPLDGLRELDAGELEGLTGAELRLRFPEFARLWEEDAGTAQTPGGESLAQLQERAWRTVQELRSTHPDGTVVAITHNFTMHAITCAVLDLPLRHFRRLRHDLASITRLELSDTRRAVLSLNETSHLRGLARS